MERRYSIATILLVASYLLEPTMASRNGLRRSASALDGDDANHATNAVIIDDNTVVPPTSLAPLRRTVADDANSACMVQASGIDLGCTAQDIKFTQVTGFDILGGPNLLPCNCSSTTATCGQYDVDCGTFEVGTVFGACNGGNGNDEVTVQMTVDFLVSTTRYDIGMYIATNGGSAKDGEQCSISTLQHGTFGDVQIWEVEGDPTSPNPAPDACPDLGSTGLLTDYPFAPVTLSCTDSDGDGLLDFDIGIVWSVKKGDYDCSMEDVERRPVASSSPKCWYDDDFRATIPINVPPEPIIIALPTNPPNHPPAPAPNGEAPIPPHYEDDDCIDDFNICFALDMSGSVCNRGAAINCGDCLLAEDCQDVGFTQGECCANFERVRQFAVEMTNSLDAFGNGTIGTSIVEFATGATTISSLLTNVSATMVELDGLIYTGGWTDHADAITECHATFASSDVEKNIILLVTDGIPTMPGSNPAGAAVASADTAKSAGTMILPVFISTRNDQDKLDYMKSLSSDGTVLDVTAFDELNGLIESLTTRVLCGGPRARDDYAETTVGVAVQIDVLENDFGNGTLRIDHIVESPTNGQFFWESLEVGYYQPNPGFVGNDTFVYEMCDDTGMCDTAVVTVAVLNHPTAIDDYATTPMNTPILIPVIPNDHHVTAVVTSITQPDSGSGEFTTHDDASGTIPLGQVNYTPPDGFIGTETFEYTICQLCDCPVEDEKCSTATVTVVVIPPAPVAVDDNAETPMETPVIIPVLDNDVSIVLLVVHNITQSPSNGVVYSGGTLGENVVYYPADGFQGTDTFKYLACDTWNQCDEALVTIDVGPPAIVAINDYTSTPQGTPVTIVVLANDQGEELTVQETTPPSDGGVAIQPDGTVIYTPDAEFVGQDTFTYTTCVRDTELCDTATVTIDVQLPPIAAINDHTSTPQATPVIITVLPNDNGEQLTVHDTTKPSHGEVAIQPNKSVLYTPDPEFVGQDTFTYTTCEGESTTVCDTATVTVDVSPPAIVAVDDSASTPKGTPVVINVLSNDSGEDLTVQDIPRDPLNGDVVIQPDNTVVYTPDPNFVGQDTFTYTACVGETTVCDTATVTVQVLPPAIVAINDSTSTPKGTPVTIPVLPNDIGDQLTVQDTTEPSNGDVTVQPDNTVVYTPDPNFVGQDTFTYTACVGETMVCDTATVTVQVLPPAIVAINDSTSTPKGTPVTIPVLPNDIGDQLTVQDTTEPSNGDVTVQPDNTVVYTPDPNFVGQDTFTYTACVGETTVCDTATVTVNVQNQPPVAIPDVVQMNVEDGPTKIIDVLANDYEPNGDPLVVSEVTDPVHGMVTISPNSKVVTYTPTPAFSGVDTFNYVACDPERLCATALVTVIINPKAVNDIVSVQEGEDVTKDVLENDSGYDLVVTYVGPPGNGICSITNSGLIKYTPVVGFVGQDECFYTACTRGTQACDTAKLIVNVSAEPSWSPSVMPSGSPTEAWYYPDWINDNQVCKNDFAEPEYMLEVQRKNYLYRSKELCCENHFWWRITQCMANEHPLYYSDGEKCDQKVFFEFHEAKFTPADWSSSDLFETLQQCCVHKFWWDKQACMEKSPRELKYYFSVNISNLNEPEFCQDADIIANALVTALERGLDDDMRASVTSIGCATITRNPDTGNPECGGCLKNDDFLGGTLGNTVVRDATGAVTSIQVEIRKKCYESKSDEDIARLTTYITTLLEGYINPPGTLTENIQSWSRDRIPAVGQLFDSVAVPESFTVIEVINPFSSKDSKYYPDWVVMNTCVNDGMEPPYMQNNAGDYLFANAEDCCSKYFAGSEGCGSSSST